MQHKNYGTFSCPGWAIFKSIYPDKSEESYSKYASAIWEQALASHALESFSERLIWDRDCLYSDFTFLFLWKFRHIKHFFLSEKLGDFCASSVKVFTEDYAKRLPECDRAAGPINAKDYPFVLLDKARTMQGCFAVHFPAIEKRKSILVCPEMIIPTGQDTGLLFYFGATDGVDTVLAQKRADFEGGGLWMTKLVFGLSLYMDAFPEMIHEAKDSDIKHSNHFVGSRSIIQANEVVATEHRNGVSPHWRRGHFRTLTSERFVRKKGMTIYINGMFVKGMAQDVDAIQ